MGERKWHMNPGTVEEMLLALLDIERHEQQTGRSVGMEDAPIVTRALFKDIGTRILRLEQAHNLNDAQ